MKLSGTNETTGLVRKEEYYLKKHNRTAGEHRIRIRRQRKRNGNKERV